MAKIQYVLSEDEWKRFLKYNEMVNENIDLQRRLYNLQDMKDSDKRFYENEIYELQMKFKKMQ